MRWLVILSLAACSNAQEGTLVWGGVVDAPEPEVDAWEPPPEFVKWGAPTCDDAVESSSSSGCDFVALDLGNLFDRPDVPKWKHRPTVLSVTNTSGEDTAQVTVTPAWAGGEPSTFDVAPRGTHALDLPSPWPQLETSVNRGSWRVRSTVPVTLYLGNNTESESTSGDATVLYPAPLQGERYVVMSWPGSVQGEDPYTSWINVVATADAPVSVRITATAPLAGGGPLPDVPAGELVVVELQPGDVLTYAAVPGEGVDLSGTSVVSDGRVAVFSSHECAYVPDPGVPYCDHLGHQLLPVDAWGDQVVADRFEPRWSGAMDVWRIVAADEGTTLEVEPPIPGVDGQVLGSGEVIEYESDVAHVVTASGPIQLGHFMVGSGAGPNDAACLWNAGLGDPSLVIVPGAGAGLDAYVVEVPSGYQQDWINVVRTAHADVWLDDERIEAEGIALGSGAELVRVPVTDGVHRIAANTAFGLTVYGYTCEGSYAFAGGLRRP